MEENNQEELVTFLAYLSTYPKALDMYLDTLERESNYSHDYACYLYELATTNSLSKLITPKEIKQAYEDLYARCKGQKETQAKLTISSWINELKEANPSIYNHLVEYAQESLSNKKAPLEIKQTKNAYQLAIQINDLYYVNKADYEDIYNSVFELLKKREISPRTWYLVTSKWMNKLLKLTKARYKLINKKNEYIYNQLKQGNTSEEVLATALIEGYMDKDNQEDWQHSLKDIQAQKALKERYKAIKSRNSFIYICLNNFRLPSSINQLIEDMEKNNQIREATIPYWQHAVKEIGLSYFPSLIK